MVERGVAQPGRVLGLGPRCRMFESCRPDHCLKAKGYPFAFFVPKLPRRPLKQALFKT